MSTRDRRKSREMALQALYAMDLISGWEADLEDFLFDREAYPGCVAFAARLVTGVRTHREAIDQTLQNRALNWSVSRMNTLDRNILRIAAFEILWCEDIPAGVSINEALDLARAYAAAETRRFLNGILDKVANPPGV